MSLLLPVHPALLAGMAGFLTSLATLALLAIVRRRRRPAAAPAGRLQFEGRALVAADGTAREDFHATDPQGDDWDRAVALLAPDFPALDAGRTPQVLPDGPMVSPVSGRVLEVSRDGSLLNLTLPGDAADPLPDPTAAPAPAAAARTLGDTTDLLPFPVWITEADGTLAWANATYLQVAGTVRSDLDPDLWPPAPLFDPGTLPPGDAEGTSARLPLATGGPGPRHWFEVHARTRDGRTLYAAANVDAAIRAEQSLREFTQTLTKTFAHLTIGLAIFDQARRLILFNPALVDMTSLPADFLAARPTLVGFLDRLRERRIIPEPKDYTSWRRKMAELEAAAVDGSYAETWSLPTGQTYRVTGRPHPDGAVIFLFEDISAEISLTRRFRAELEMGQAVIDSLDEAVAVFTPGGVLAMTNAAYADLWGHAPDTGLGDLSVADATTAWLARSAPTPAWGDFRDFVRQGQNRVEWSADVLLRDGRVLLCRFVPLAGGGTLATFRPLRGEDRIERRQSA